MVASVLLALALGTLGAIADIPKPWLNTSDIAVAGASFWVRCSLPENAFNNIQVRLVAQNHLGEPLKGTCRSSTWYTPPKLCWFRVHEDEEGALNVSCEAELKPYSSQMEWKEIRVDAKPRLDPGSCPAQQNWTEGETQILDCRARGSPDPDLECTKDGISFPVRTPIRAQRIHAGIYLCRAWNYLGRAERNVTVWVQYIPKPRLNSLNTAVAGTDLWVRCSLPQNAFNNIRVRLVAQTRLGWPLNGTCSDSAWYKHPKHCEYQVPEDEEGALNVSCEAELKPYSSQMEWKEIRVDGKPRLDPGSCPAQQNWIEGETQILDCRARGSPDPDLECTKDGISFPVRTPIRAERIHTGIYLCRAWNYLGSIERNVTIWVQYSAPDSTPDSAPDSAPSSLLPVLFGIPLAIVALLVLTGLCWWHHHSTEDDKDWHRTRQSRPPGHQGATVATKGVS